MDVSFKCVDLYSKYLYIYFVACLSKDHTELM